MSSKTTKTHDGESLAMIPFIESEYKLWKASRLKNRIVLALCVTNTAWLILFLAYIIFKI